MTRHLWHIHLGIHRQYADDVNAMNSVAQAITGGSGGTTPTPTPPPSGGSSPHAGRPWPSYMPHNEYFGDINGPNASHGGYYANERPDVQAIQDQLLVQGLRPWPGLPEQLGGREVRAAHHRCGRRVPASRDAGL